MRLVSACYGNYYPFDSIKLFNEFDATDNPDDLRVGDVLVVWGGADIHPSLYGKGRSFESGAGEAPSMRDRIEWALMQRATELSIPIIGVCRGGQMLCALAGGILAQHVDNHYGMHTVVTEDGEIISVTSIHHQMMVPDNTEHELIAWTPAPLSTTYHDEDNTNLDITIEPEFIYFNKVKGYAVQWHPEMMSNDTRANQYVLKYITKGLQCL